MTDEQILNALRSCGDGIAICDGCPYEGQNHCSILAKQDIIARFEELKAENVKLRDGLKKEIETTAKRIETNFLREFADDVTFKMVSRLNEIIIEAINSITSTRL